MEKGKAMGKNLAIKMAEMKQEYYNKGFLDGVTFGKLIAEVTNNNVYGHGYTNFERFEKEFDRIMTEEIHGKEPEEIMAGLQRKFDKIGGLKRAKKTE